MEIFFEVVSFLLEIVGGRVERALGWRVGDLVLYLVLFFFWGISFFRKRWFIRGCRVVFFWVSLIYSKFLYLEVEYDFIEFFYFGFFLKLRSLLVGVFVLF